MMTRKEIQKRCRIKNKERYAEKEQLRRSTDPLYLEKRRQISRKSQKRRHLNPELRKKDSESSRRSHLKRLANGYIISRQSKWWRAYQAKKYGLTLDMYNELKNRGRCGLCGTTDPGTKTKSKDGINRFPIDHDHISGKVRDILCNNCNVGLGCFFDNPILLRAAADYLERHLTPELVAENSVNRLALPPAPLGAQIASDSC